MAGSSSNYADLLRRVRPPGATLNAARVRTFEGDPTSHPSLHGAGDVEPAPEGRDVDVDRLNESMDNYYNALKSDVNRMFGAVKARLQSAHRRELHETRNALQDRVAELEDKCARQQEMLLSKTRRLRDGTDILSHMARRWAFKRREERALALQTRFFHQWRSSIREQQHQRRTIRRWAVPTHRRRLAARVLAAWRSWARLSRQRKEQQLWALKTKEVTAKVIRQYEEALGNLRSQLEGAQRVIRHQQTDKRIFEENMQQAFLRGVAAMNVEAMSVFKKRGPHEGRLGEPPAIPPTVGGVLRQAGFPIAEVGAGAGAGAGAEGATGPGPVAAVTAGRGTNQVHRHVHVDHPDDENAREAGFSDTYHEGDVDTRKHTHIHRHVHRRKPLGEGPHGDRRVNRNVWKHQRQ